MSVTSRFTDLLPELTKAEYQRLRDDIAENGVRVPIIVDEDGTILDGRHRSQICDELGIECPVAAPLTDLEDHDKRLLAVSVNVNRRHLTDAQRVMVGRQLKDDIAKRAKKRQGARSDLVDKCPQGDAGKSRDEIAALVGLGSGKTFERHEAIIEVVEEQAPDLIEAIEAGEIEDESGKKVAADMKWVRKQLNDREAKAKQAEMTAEQSFIAPKLKLASAQDWLAAVEPGSVDLLITDPPYATDVDDIASFASSWVNLALDTLKPTGRAYICTGAYPIELHAYLSVLLERDGFTVGNVLAWHYPDTLGPAPKLDYKAAWQAIHYIRGPEAAPLNAPTLTEATTVHKINMNSGIVGGRVHAWQKPDQLAERLILQATEPGDRVIDCFAGTGTFLLAAGRLGRVADGCELSTEMADKATARGCELV